MCGYQAEHCDHCATRPVEIAELELDSIIDMEIAGPIPQAILRADLCDKMNHVLDLRKNVAAEQEIVPTA